MNARSLKLLAGVMALVSLVACAKARGPGAPQVTGLWRFPADKAVMVGKIELHPPLQKGEQALRTKQGKLLQNAFFLFCGDQIIDLKTAGTDSVAGAHATKLDEEFFLKIDKGRTAYLSGGVVFSAYDPPDPAALISFSHPLRVDMEADDKAVYIGTIQVYRDEKNVVKSVMVRDDYAWAADLFKKRFGRKMTLRKVLASPVLRAAPEREVE